VRFPALASYLATKILVSHLRDHRFDAVWPDFAAFRQAGVLDANPLRLIRRHRDVKSLPAPARHHRRAQVAAGRTGKVAMIKTAIDEMGTPQ